jgi:hypothetical protein
MKKVLYLIVFAAISLMFCTNVYSQKLEAKAAKETTGIAKATYKCPMCDGVQSDKAGKCPKCGMDLVKNSEKACSYKCPSDDGVMSDKAGKCPKCGKELVKCDKTKCPATCRMKIEKSGKMDKKK